MKNINILFGVCVGLGLLAATQDLAGGMSIIASSAMAYAGIKFSGK